MGETGSTIFFYSSEFSKTVFVYSVAQKLWEKIVFASQKLFWPFSIIKKVLSRKKKLLTDLLFFGGPP